MISAACVIALGWNALAGAARCLGHERPGRGTSTEDKPAGSMHPAFQLSGGLENSILETLN